MRILAPSVLSADFSRLGEDIRVVADAGAEWIHLDVMDGEFVPNISFGAPVISSVRKVTKAFFDVHLMINEPVRYIEDFVKAGADIITVHYEACSNVKDTLEKIRSMGVKTGLAISPDTDVEVVRDYIKELDMVLIMSVYPGFGGQKFIEKSIDKIKTVSCMMKNLSREDIWLEVDGGITPENAGYVCDAGANVLVAGSAVFGGDMIGNVKSFLEIIN